MTFMMGIGIIVFAGLMAGSFGLGLKKTPNWKFEHTWGLGSLFALVLIPWPVAFLTCPNLFEVYGSVPSSALIAAALFGAACGVGGVFYGLGIDVVGVAMGVSLMEATIAVFGSAVPMLIREPGEFLTASGAVLVIGLVIMVFGVIACAMAGKRREVEQAGLLDESSDDSSDIRKKSFIVGLVFCVLSGVLSPFVNFSFIFGEQIMDAAKAAGAADAMKVNAIWAIVFTTNYLVNVLYCIYLMIKNKTAKEFITNGSWQYWGWALYLGMFWVIGMLLYAVGATKLGKFGFYAGFPLMLTCTLLSSNIIGALIGEWKGSSPKTRYIMTIGVVILVIAAIFFGLSTGIKS